MVKFYDCEGNVVYPGAYLEHPEQSEVGYYYRFSKGEAELMARWGIGVLEKRTMEDRIKDYEESRKRWPDFTIDLTPPDTESLRIIKRNSPMYNALKVLETHPDGGFGMDGEWNDEGELVHVQIWFSDIDLVYKEIRKQK